MPILSRDYQGDDDLRLMQGLAEDCWRLAGPFAVAHVGDLPWRMYQHLDKLKEVRIRLWVEGRRAVAWAWLWLPGEVDFQLHPDTREVFGELLDWFESKAAPDEDGLLTMWALDTHKHIVGALEARGFERGQDRWYEHLVLALEGASLEPELPEGFESRAVHGEEDLERRVAVHRAAFAPSRVVPESYRRVMQSWPYRPELDRVVVAPDGRFGAFCLCWLDEENGVVELEPLGTHPDYRRRGLARAVCLDGLRSAQAAGAHTALVYGVGGGEAIRLYEGLGFTSRARHVPFRKRSGGESAKNVRR